MLDVIQRQIRIISFRSVFAKACSKHSRVTHTSSSSSLIVSRKEVVLRFAWNRSLNFIYLCVAQLTHPSNTLWHYTYCMCNYPNWP